MIAPLPSSGSKYFNPKNSMKRNILSVTRGWINRKCGKIIQAYILVRLIEFKKKILCNFIFY